MGLRGSNQGSGRQSGKQSASQEGSQPGVAHPILHLPHREDLKGRSHPAQGRQVRLGHLWQVGWAAAHHRLPQHQVNQHLVTHSLVLQMEGRAGGP